MSVDRYQPLPCVAYAHLLQWSEGIRRVRVNDGTAFRPEEFSLVVACAMYTGATARLEPGQAADVDQLVAELIDRYQCGPAASTGDRAIDRLDWLADSAGDAVAEAVVTYARARAFWEERPGIRALCDLETYASGLAAIVPIWLDMLDFDWLRGLAEQIFHSAVPGFTCSACGRPVPGEEIVWTVAVRLEMATPQPCLPAPEPKRTIAFCQACGAQRDFDRLHVPVRPSE